MKTTLITLLLAVVGMSSFAQQIKRNPHGKIKSITFNQAADKSKIPRNSKIFFETYFDMNEHMAFKDKPVALFLIQILRD